MKFLIYEEKKIAKYTKGEWYKYTDKDIQSSILYLDKNKSFLYNHIVEYG